MSDHQALLRFRRAVREFLAFSEKAAADEGLTTQQHQLLLAIEGLPDDAPSTSAIAEQLLLKNHSAVELVDRAEAAGLVERRADPDDARRQRISLTTDGRAHLDRLTPRHLAELRRLRAEIVASLEALG